MNVLKPLPLGSLPVFLLKKHLNTPEDLSRVSVCRLIHHGDELQMMAYNLYGRVIGQGAGSVAGNQIQFTLQRVDMDYGTGTGTVASDGRQISGQWNATFQL